MAIQTSPRFLACMPFILKEEGGYSNTPGDHGGATDDGIIQREYSVFRHSNGLPLQSVKLITDRALASAFPNACLCAFRRFSLSTTRSQAKAIGI
jgi:lysozyme family protein